MLQLSRHWRSTGLGQAGEVGHHAGERGPQGSGGELYRGDPRGSQIVLRRGRQREHLRHQVRPGEADAQPHCDQPDAGRQEPRPGAATVP